MTDDKTSAESGVAPLAAPKKGRRWLRYLMYALLGAFAAYLFVAKPGVNPTLGQWIGVPAPDFIVTTVDGKQFQLSALRGKRVIIDLWATWCPPCRREIPHFIALAKDPDIKNVAIVGISSEEQSVVKDFADKQGINYPVATTKALPRPYSNADSIPTTFVVDRNGIIENVVVGYHSQNELKGLATGPDYVGPVKQPPAEPKAGK